MQDSITPSAPKGFLAMLLPTVCSCPCIVPNPDNFSGRCYPLITTVALLSHQPSMFHREGTKLKPLIDLSTSPFKIVLISGLISVTMIRSFSPLSASWMLGGMSPWLVLYHMRLRRNTLQSVIYHLHPWGFITLILADGKLRSLEVQWPLRSLRTTEI